MSSKDRVNIFPSRMNLAIMKARLKVQLILIVVSELESLSLDYFLELRLYNEQLNLTILIRIHLNLVIISWSALNNI